MFKKEMFDWAVKEELYEEDDFETLDDIDKSLIETAYNGHHKNWKELFESNEKVELYENCDDLMNTPID